MTLNEKNTARLCDKELSKHIRDKQSYNLVDATIYICQSCGKKVKKITKEYGKMPIAMWVLQQTANQYVSNEETFITMAPEDCSCGGILKSVSVSLQDKVSNKTFRTLRPQITLSISTNITEEQFELSKHADFMDSTDFNNESFAEKCLLFACILFKTIKKSKIVDAFASVQPNLFASLKNKSTDELLIILDTFSDKEKIAMMIHLNKSFFNKGLFKMMPRNILEMLFNKKEYKANVKELCGDFRYILFFESILCPTCVSADYGLIVAIIMNTFQNELDEEDFRNLLLIKPELFKLCDTAYSAEHYKNMVEDILLYVRKMNHEFELIQKENENLKENLKKEIARETIVENRSKKDINKIKELKSIISSLKDEIQSLKEKKE